VKEKLKLLNMSGSLSYFIARGQIADIPSALDLVDKVNEIIPRENVKMKDVKKTHKDIKEFLKSEIQS